MALATWWYDDLLPRLERLDGMTVEIASDDPELAAVGRLPLDEVWRRRSEGHRPYLARMRGIPVGYGWVATRSAEVGELGLRFELPRGHRYLWDFATAPSWRGLGIYPRLLEAIMGRECPPATRLWILYAPENQPSGLGISRAGFQTVAELSLGADGKPALVPRADRVRAEAGARLLGLPLSEAPLDPCWGCGGCTCPPQGDRCGCAVTPER